MSESPVSHTPLNILVVDDETNIRKTLSVCLESEGHKVRAVSNANDAVAEVTTRSFDVCLLDMRLGTEDGLDLIPVLLGMTPWLKIIVITAYASIETAVEAIRRGAADYLPKPFTPMQINMALAKVTKIHHLEQEVDNLQEEHIRRVLAGSKSLQEAADILGIDQASLWRRRKRYGI